MAVDNVLSGTRSLPTGLPLASTVIVVPRERPEVDDDDELLSVTEYVAVPLAGVTTLTEVLDVGGGGPGRHRGTTLQERSAAIQPALPLLTPEQRRRWDALVGREFDGDAETFGGPGDHGFGGPGHGFDHGDDVPGGPHSHDSGNSVAPLDHEGPPPRD